MIRLPPSSTRTDPRFPYPPLFRSPQFAAAYPVLRLRGIAASIDLIGVSFEPLLMATNHARKSVTIKLINAALLLCLLSILLPRFGLEGAAAANVVVALAGFFLMGWAAHRHASKERSEEHTSELQSLMRISYAVFCLKKKKEL